MSQWKQEPASAWQRVVAARARGEQPEAADVEEARRLARPDDTPAWARLIAERATGQVLEPVEPVRKPRSEFEKRLMARLGYRDVPDDVA